MTRPRSDRRSVRARPELGMLVVGLSCRSVHRHIVTALAQCPVLLVSRFDNAPCAVDNGTGSLGGRSDERRSGVGCNVSSGRRVAHAHNTGAPVSFSFAVKMTRLPSFHIEVTIVCPGMTVPAKRTLIESYWCGQRCRTVQIGAPCQRSAARACRRCRTSRDRAGWAS